MRLLFYLSNSLCSGLRFCPMKTTIPLMRTKLSTFCAVLFFSLSARSQSITPSVFNSGGGSSAGPLVGLDWSLGEPTLVSTMQASGGRFFITNGFQQPELSYKDRELHLFAADEITVLPSPTRGRVDVWIDTKQQGLFTFSVHDATGRLLYTRTKANFGGHAVETFDLTSQPSGMYVLNISLKPILRSIAQYGAYRIIKL